jgi:hypothetical protein
LRTVRSHAERGNEINDPAVFRSVRVDPQLGTIVWPNGADIDPDVHYRGLKPAWMDMKQNG